jgi:hypothetical protein
MTIMKSNTQAARDDSVEQLRQKKINAYMEQHGVSRADAEAAIGNISAGAYKAAPTSRDTALATIEYNSEVIAKREKTSLAKATDDYLCSPEGRIIYADFAAAKFDGNEAPVTKRHATRAFDGLVDAFAKQFGMNKWKATIAVLDTPLGRDLYNQRAA